MKYEFLREVLSATSLSHLQKVALALAISAPTPTTAAQQFVGDIRKITVRDEMVKFGMFNMSPDEMTLEVTTRGRDMAMANNIVDDTGELTDEGRSLAENGGEQLEVA